MSLKVFENVPLAPLTTVQVGGPARFFAAAASEDDVAEGFEYAKAKDLEVFILGGGSNILVSDSGFDGLVLKVAIMGIESLHNGTTLNSAVSESSRQTTTKSTENTVKTNAVLLRAAAGEDWDAFVAHCVENELAGVECLSGIPGFVGGTPVQNVGAYGQEVSETIVSVRCFDRETQEFMELANVKCGFEYRKSIFNSSERGRYVVLSVIYDLDPGGEAKIVYKDLVDHFGGRKPTLAETREAVLRIRRAKSMVIDASDPNCRSAGSFFKNPIVPPRAVAEIARRSEIQNVPYFRLNEEEVKIPAAWLIEHAGFYKGFIHGNAGISSNHTLALINRGDAAAAEIVELKEMVQKAVRSKFDIDLQPEPVFVGF